MSKTTTDNSKAARAARQLNRVRRRERILHLVGYWLWHMGESPTYYRLGKLLESDAAVIRNDCAVLEADGLLIVNAPKSESTGGRGHNVASPQIVPSEAGWAAIFSRRMDRQILSETTKEQKVFQDVLKND